jgi:ABC-type transporter Mla MlaB component
MHLSSTSGIFDLTDAQRDEREMGGCMKIHLSGNIASLEGDWTLAGVTQSTIDSLSVALQQIEPIGAKTLHIDCRDVNSIDTNGLHLLYGWVQCARFRGVEPELILSHNNLQQSFQSLGLRCRYTPLIVAGHNYTASQQQKKEITA